MPYTEENYVVILGGLHIEMCVLKLLGDWLEKCGWDSALVQAFIMTVGKANAFLKVSHVTHTGYAHQVTAAALYFLQKQAHDAVMIVKLLKTGARGKPSNILNSCTGQ